MIGSSICYFIAYAGPPGILIHPYFTIFLSSYQMIHFSNHLFFCKRVNNLDYCFTKMTRKETLFPDNLSKKNRFNAQRITLFTTLKVLFQRAFIRGLTFFFLVTNIRTELQTGSCRSDRF